MYYHVLGTEQSEDILIYSDPDNPEYHFGAATTYDGNWVKMSISKDTSPVNKLWIAKVEGGTLRPDGDQVIWSFLF